MNKSIASNWHPQEDEFLRRHPELPIAVLAHTLGRTVNAVRSRRSILGAIGKRLWSPEEIELLRARYARPVLRLAEFAATIGRTKEQVCIKASALGLTNPRRRKVEKRKKDPRFTDVVERRAYQSEARKRHIAEHGHPRGALGMKHSEATRAILGERSRQMWQQAKATNTGVMSEANRQKRSDLMSQRSSADPRMRQGYTRTRGGKREDLGDIYFRSAWEANYARYLNWLIAQGQIKSWRYEPITFWFEAIKRGVRSYKPDFEVVNMDDSIEYHEVKGWDYARGQTARKRMAKYHPTIRLLLVDEQAYRAIAKWKALIPDWE